MGTQNFERKILKVFLHPPPPSEREGLVRTAELTVSNVTILSIAKTRS
jgi:hypothetical protein